MTYTEALELMAQGKKVRLSDWLGYWFMKDQKVFVHTRDGQILDTPTLSRYQHRDDWQEAGDHFGFEVALLSMKNGKIARRLHDPQDDFYFIYEEELRIGSFTDLAASKAKFLKYKGYTYSDEPTLDEGDLLATDWVIVHDIAL